MQGSFYAFSNECTHRLAFLTDGYLLRDREIVCTLHWACFDLATGRPTDGPAGSDLAVFAVRTEGDELQIEWPEALPPDAVVALNR